MRAFRIEHDLPVPLRGDDQHIDLAVDRKQVRRQQVPQKQGAVLQHTETASCFAPQVLMVEWPGVVIE